ncbi:MAG TPA: exosortase, partial [Solirubrobacterales bacterium]|nr:exosortase [Solirubrobacterales bacterium]
MYQSDVGWPSSLARIDRKSLWWWGGVLGPVVLCLGWLFGDALGLLWQNYRRPEYSHGFIVPAVTAFVVWQRWPALSRERSRDGGWAGLALVGVALVVLSLSKLAHTGTPQVLALVIALAGVALAGLGWRAMRHLWVPLAFLLFALPLPSTVHVLFSLRLQLISSGIGAWLLQLAGVSVFLDGNVIDLGVYRLQVAEACSGLRYLFPLGAFSFLCAWLYRGPFRDRVVIFLAAVPITVVMNSVRIALTGLLIEHGSVALAEGFLHLFEGWVIFLAALAALFALMWLLTRLRGRRVGPFDLLDFDRVAGHPQRAPAAAPPGGGGTTGGAGSRPPGPLLACCGLLLAGALTLGWLTDRTEII